MLHPNWRAAIVDLDGTMIDTVGDFDFALNAMLTELGWPQVSRGFIERTVGKGSEHLIHSALAEVGAPAALFDAAWISYQANYLSINGQHSNLYPGVMEGLQALIDAGLKLACLTNKPTAFATPLLAAKGLDKFFSFVFGGDAFERKKPDPLPLLKTCLALGTRPEQTLMIGDSANDAQAGHAAGCPVVLVSYGYNHGQPILEVPALAHIDRLDALLWLPEVPLEVKLMQAWALAERSDNLRAQGLVDEVLQAAVQQGQIDPQVRSKALASMLCLRRGEVEAAARHAAEAQALVPNDPALLAHGRLAAARVHFSVGANDTALDELERAWPVAEASGEPHLKFHCENMLGIVAGNLGHVARSIEWHRQAQLTAQRGGLSRMEAVAAANAAGRCVDIGERAVAEGRVGDADLAWRDTVAQCQAAMPIALVSGSKQAQLVNEANLASALAYLDETEAALAGFARVQTLAEDVGDPVSALHSAQAHVEMLRRQGDLPGARWLAQRAIDTGERLSARTALAAMYELASAIDEDLGQAVSALACYKRFHALHNEVAAERARQRAQVLAVRLQTERALTEAQHSRQQAQQLSQENLALLQATRSLGEQAMQDALTGLANRRRLDEALALALPAARTAHTPLCVALLDIDHFKQVNDNFSHAIGDRVLQQIGAILRQQCRAQDLPARYGGEEFVLVLQGVDLAQAVLACERVRQAIQAWPWASIHAGLAVTASFGLADIAAAANLGAGLAEVDALLYAAKRGGRNRVVSVAG